MNPVTTKITREQQLVLERLRASNPHLKLAISTEKGIKTYTRKQIAEHVERLDDVGRQYINDQMDFLRSLRNGDIHKMLAEIPDED